MKNFKTLLLKQIENQKIESEKLKKIETPRELEQFLKERHKRHLQEIREMMEELKSLEEE